MRVVLDTNVILSALITQGLSSRVLEVCVDKHVLYISSFIINEVLEKLKRKFKVGTRNTRKVKTFIASAFITVEPVGNIPVVCRDPDDNNVLWLAECVKADCLISGDRDLLSLKSHKGVEIITPREFMEGNYSSQES